MYYLLGRVYTGRSKIKKEAKRCTATLSDERSLMHFPVQSKFCTLLPLTGGSYLFGSSGKNRKFLNLRRIIYYYIRTAIASYILSSLLTQYIYEIIYTIYYCINVIIYALVYKWIWNSHSDTRDRDTHMYIEKHTRTHTYTQATGGFTWTNCVPNLRSNRT